MRVDELVSSLLRRPLALLLIAAVAAGGAFVGWSRATTTYESTATVVVVPSSQGGAQQDASDNPFTRLDYNIAQLALVVSRQLSSDAVRDQVVAAGGDGSFTADTMSSDNSAVAQLTPMIALSATAPTADGARAAVQALVQQAGAQLSSVQAASGVVPAAQAEVVTSAAPSTGAAMGNPRVRSAGILGIAGGVAALLLAVVTTPLVDRRRQRKADQEAEAAEIVDEAPQVVRPVRPVPPARPEQPARVEAPPAAPVASPTAAPKRGRRDEAETRREREAAIRQLVREEWDRSDSNVAWTRAQQRAAFDRATRQYDEQQAAAASATDDPVADVHHLDQRFGRRNA